MKLSIALILLSLSLTAFSAEYSCTMEGEEGAINLSYDSSKKAQVVLQVKGKSKTYKNCRADRDNFGLLFDCSNDKLDFMVLINDELSPVTGGIMSTTHDLFVDLEC